MRTVIGFLTLTILPSLAFANKTISEGVAASSFAITVSTNPVRVLVATDSYRGGEIQVGLYTSSNVIVSNSPTNNNVAIYSTGAITTPTLNVGTVVYGDGTTQTTKPVAATALYLGSDHYTNVTVSAACSGSIPCIGTTTVTMVGSARIKALATLQMYNANLGATQYVAWLDFNGNCVNQNSPYGAVCQTGTGASIAGNLGYNITEPPDYEEYPTITSGVYNVCLAACILSGTSVRFTDVRIVISQE